MSASTTSDIAISNIENAASEVTVLPTKSQRSELEEEMEKLKEIQNQAAKYLKRSPAVQKNTGYYQSMKVNHTGKISAAQTAQEREETDSKSVYVGNVDYAATATDLEQHFHGCGTIARVSIITDKFHGNPKGFAYVEFSDKEGMTNALAMNSSLFKGRQIKVTPKRTNKHGISTSDRPVRKEVVYVQYGGYGGYNPHSKSNRFSRSYKPY